MTTIWHLRFRTKEPSSGTLVEFRLHALGATRREAAANALEFWPYTREAKATDVRLVGAEDRGLAAATSFSYVSVPTKAGSK